MSKNRRRRQRQNVAPAMPAAVSGFTLAGHRVAPATQWRWRTFPVYFTFASTLFITAFVAQLLAGTRLVNLLVLAGTIALSAGLAHLVSVRFIASRIETPPRS